MDVPVMQASLFKRLNQQVQKSNFCTMFWTSELRLVAITSARYISLPCAKFDEQRHQTSGLHRLARPSLFRQLAAYSVFGHAPS